MRSRTFLRDTRPQLLREAVEVVDRPGYALGELGTRSNLRVRWRCSSCRRQWETSVANRSNGTGCPDCA